MQLGCVDTKTTVSGQRFSGQFEQDSLVHSCKVSHIREKPLSLEMGAFWLQICAIYGYGERTKGWLKPPFS